MSHLINDPLGGIDQRSDAAVAARLAAIGDVLKERRHQIDSGHTPEADSKHALGELSQAAMATIAAADDQGPTGRLFTATFWPFDWREAPKSSVGRRRLLVKAAALLLAELERLPSPAALQERRVLLLTDRQ